jgi:hypothetical protein
MASQEPPVALDRLPDELLLMVLERLPGAALATVRLVSRRWRALADDPLLRARFYLTTDPSLASEEVLELVTARPALFSVTLQDHQLTGPLLQALVDHPTLDQLHLVEQEGGSYQQMSYERLYMNIWSRNLEARWQLEATGGRRTGGWGPAVHHCSGVRLVLCAKPHSRIFGVVEDIYEVLNSLKA